MSKDYSKIKIPFLSNQIIKTKADSFRKKYWNEGIPVDIEKIIDIKFEIDIIPVKNSNNFFDADALMVSSWKAIYVDYNNYLNDNKNRLRFSFAHEIGHFVLHKNIYESFSIKSFEDFYNLFENISSEQYGYLETQANKFANYLLVPRDFLFLKKEKLLQKIGKSINLKEHSTETLNSYLAIPLSKIFGVSEQVIEIALSDSKIKN